MIDLHCHILPGIDDGASDATVSLDMARLFVEEGITHAACTPHILPGLYHNEGQDIRQRVAHLQSMLDEAGIPLTLTTGADNHMVPDFVAGLRSGRLLSLGDTRYVLVEPPHHVAPQRFEEFFFNLQVAGYVPILTHPERLTWVHGQYATVQKLAHTGTLMQITAGSLVGAFGRGPQSLAERMLSEGCVHIIATDAHDTVRRPPLMLKAREVAARMVGEAEAENLTTTRPRGILENAPLSSLPGIIADNQLSTASRNARATASGRKIGAHDDQETRHLQSRGVLGALSDRLRRIFD